MSKKNDADSVILTTRSRIARNIAGYRFPALNTNEDRRNILKTVKDSFFKLADNKKYYFYNMSRLTRFQRQFLLERHMISAEMTQRLYAKGLILKYNAGRPFDSDSILINEEDHVRIRSIREGLNIYRTYSEIEKLERILEKNIRFAYEKDFGYLTSSLSNIGTALRISVIAHLPGLVLSGKIEDLIKRLLNIKLNIKGVFGENSEIAGNLFQVSNNVSTGKYEKDILDEMDAVCLNIVEEEKKAIELLKENIPIIVEDSVLRAYGMLEYARMLSFGESLELLSMIALGVELKIINKVKPFDFYQLISLLGESNIIIGKKNNEEVSVEDIDRMRAELIRAELLKY
ncbi:MAG: hypothetical protein JW997_02140 [Actinobacteria bacterium]|nr:hypothetical protein [Actinomycetota bacterium]